MILSDDEITTLVVGAVKAYAAAGGRDIALGDTDFAGTVEQSIDRNRISYDESTRTFTFTSNDGTPFTLTLPEATNTVQGLSERANTSEAEAGTSHKFIDAAVLQTELTRRLTAHGSGVPQASAGDAGEPLVGVAGADPRYAPVAADKVSVDASGFNGNLGSGDDTAQRALDTIDGLELGSTGGTDEADVNRLIDARVPSWARMTQRFTDEQQAVFDAFMGDAWATSTDVKIATVFSTVATPSNPENFTFQNPVVTGPRYTNVFALLEVPVSKKTALAGERLVVGELAPISLMDATHVEDEGGNAYYTIPLADVPASTTLTAESRQQRRFDSNLLGGLPAVWAERGNTDLVPDAKLPPHVAAPTAFAQLNPGLTLTRTDASPTAAAPSELTPAQEISATQRGEYHWALDLRIAPVSDVNMGFVRGKANQTAADRTVNLTTILFASDLWQEGLWTTASRTNGLEMFEVPVYSLNTLVGTYTILLVRQQVGAVVRVRPYWYWTGAAGATGATLTAELRGSFTSSDASAAAAPAPSGGGGTPRVEGKFTPSTSAGDWGGLSTRASPRSVAAPVPTTIGLAADGTLPADISLASDVVTIAKAGRLVIDGAFIVQETDSAANNNNSRSRVVGWVERAASTGNFAIEESSVSTSSYIRVSHNYWNHGCGYTYEHIHAELDVAAGDRLRLRVACIYKQANTVSHQVAATNPDSSALPGSSVKFALGEGSSSAAAPTVYDSLTRLPTSGFSEGDVAYVKNGTTSVMQFLAISSTEWKCVSGTSDYLVDGLADVTTNNRFVQPAGGGKWDFRFPWFLVNLGSPDVAGGYVDSNWIRISASDIANLPARAVGNSRSRAAVELEQVLDSEASGARNYRIVFLGKDERQRHPVQLHGRTRGRPAAAHTRQRLIHFTAMPARQVQAQAQGEAEVIQELQAFLALPRRDPDRGNGGGDRLLHLPALHPQPLLQGARPARRGSPGRRQGSAEHVWRRTCPSSGASGSRASEVPRGDRGVLRLGLAPRGALGRLRMSPRK